MTRGHHRGSCPEVGVKKRASFRISPDVVDQAIELRRRGLTVRAIAGELGCSKTAVHDAVRHVPVGVAAVSAEDLERASDLEQTVREMLLVVRGMIHDLGQRLKGSSNSKIKPAHFTAATRMIVELQKLSALLRGQATTRTESVHRDEPALSEDERATIARLSRLLEEDER